MKLLFFILSTSLFAFISSSQATIQGEDIDLPESPQVLQEKRKYLEEQETNTVKKIKLGGNSQSLEKHAIAVKEEILEFSQEIIPLEGNIHLNKKLLVESEYEAQSAELEERKKAFEQKHQEEARLFVSSIPESQSVSISNTSFEDSNKSDYLSQLSTDILLNHILIKFPFEDLESIGLVSKAFRIHCVQPPFYNPAIGW